MGGFFGGKKNKANDQAAEAAAQSATARKSRRIVTPGQKPGSPAAPAGRGPTPTAPANPASERVAKPGAPATSQSRPGSGGSPAQPGPMLGGEPKPGGQPLDRPKSRDPIQASSPLAFAGDLASGTRTGPARTGDQALLDFLTGKAGLLDAGQAAQVLAKASQAELPIDGAAVQLGFLTEDQLVSALTQECWVPHLKVDKYEIRKKALDTVAREDALHYGVFPVDKLGSLLTLAMVNPLDAETIRVLESKTGLDIKKVVATRSEIHQGIEKYYSGQLVAKDTSIAFTQDVEPKSVTQMLSKVTVKDTTSIANRSLPSAPVAKHDSDIVPEIQDIDDLLASDDVIAPAIIEPIGIEPMALEPVALPSDEIEPMDIAVGEIEPSIDELAEIAINDPAESIAGGISDEGLLDLDIDLALPPPPAPAKPAAEALEPLARPVPASKPSIAPALPKPSAPAKSVEPAPAKPAAPMKPVPAPTAAAVKAAEPASVKPAVPAPAPTKSAAPARSGEAAPARSAPPASAPAPAKVAAPAKIAAQIPTAAPVFINLVPVMEEEFQHAITHGKAHVFEKWVGLQTRNRIINGVPVEPELERVLGGLYAAPRR